MSPRPTSPAPTGPLALSLTECLEAIAARLTEAARVTQAALACAGAGAEDEAVRLEQHTYETDKLLSAVTILHRIRRDRQS